MRRSPRVRDADDFRREAIVGRGREGGSGLTPLVHRRCGVDDPFATKPFEVTRVGWRTPRERSRGRLPTSEFVA